MSHEIIRTVLAGIVTIILSSGLCYYIVERAKSRPWKSGKAPDVEKLEQRLESLEQRLTDIQDIVLSIDDQLKRSSGIPLEK